MTDRLTILPRPIATSQPGTSPATRRSESAQGSSFDQLLRSRLEQPDVRFSRHASERMQQRGIQMTPAQNERLNKAVSMADAKGGRDSLVLLDDLALVVSIKNQTVVTVTERDQMQNNVFTNIDSAVIA